MKNNYLKCISNFVFCILVSAPTFAQNPRSFWTEATPKQKLVAPVNADDFATMPSAKHYVQNIDQLKSALEDAPSRKGNSNPSNVILDFPNSRGSFDSYRILEASIMEEALQNKYPNMRSYVGQGVKNPSSLIRFSVTPKGLNTVAFTDQGIELIDISENGADNEYLVYNRRDVNNSQEEWICDFVDDVEDNTTFDESGLASRNANDGQMREFRLAIACTVEYAQFHGGTVPDVMAAMVEVMTSVNGVYEKDLSVTMVMVDNESIIFLGPDVESDPYTNSNSNAMLNQNQTTVDANIGVANYDIGHVFTTGGGGIAELRSPCTGSKARGVTGLPNPIGDRFALDFVAHEMGHQFGSPHTFNGNAGSNCLNQRTQSTAYEPGSGSTIMSYAGICSPQNVQLNSDGYFHQKSLQVMFDNITSGLSQCATLTPTGNSAPTADAGTNYTMPKSTPYKLTGSSTDPDGIASHTYTWEQYDLGPTGAPTETTLLGPIVRSRQGTVNPVRYIPRLEDIAVNGGVSAAWEKLAAISRPLNFRLTVRDNVIAGGQTATDIMTATVNADAGPFQVTSQSTNQIVWTPGDTETITWNVAGTTGNGINTANVNILLSTDKGVTYDTVLASNVPNDGSQDITVPNVSAAFCRVMVEAVGNIFFNVNEEFLAIGDYTYIPGNACQDYFFTADIQLEENASQFSGYTLPIPDSKTITDINVSVDVTTSNNAELVIGIRGPYNSPSGITYLLQNVNRCPGLPDVIVTFDDEGVVNPCTDTSNNIAIQPAQPLSAADGSNSQGDWVFFIGDVVVNNNFATWNNVTLTICEEGGFEPVLSTTNVGLDASFSVFPNPNNGEFTVKFNGTSGNVDLQVFDIRGRSVFNNSYDSAGEFNQTINLGNVQSGMYLLNVNTDAGKVTKKLIVE
ncbi:T9SS type A sorting domain-containing protein [Subsaximicrobium wynnwilliamsii]|uniref:T9SS type A sorting domain-containing protein n=1 Tax=Subsaximicrobium wynnwilliamsii TaxID=291179 RepID=A0A5C6ZGN6_9FLAO|nr:M12 family metallo-peptidase [Subsaximicrobium wynnwilliamsii]TXD88382.1 T9SS type A sorting domain-containing protein [Subsaximicrobium wynnwilliamsii]